MSILLSRLSIIFFFLAAALTFAGAQLGLPALSYTGFMSLGLASLAAGGRVVLTGQAFFLPAGDQSLRRKSEHFTGPAARLWGFIFILFGLVTAVAGLAGVFFPVQAVAFLDRALDTPLGWGILSLLFGAGMTLYGLTRLLGGGGRSGPGALVRLRDAGYRLFGLACLLIGLGLAGLGLVSVIAPHSVMSWLANLSPAMP
jgi:hypothetical protein